MGGCHAVSPTWKQTTEIQQGKFLFDTTPISSEDVVAFRHEAAHWRLVLALSHCLLSLNIWPAVWSHKHSAVFQSKCGCSVASIVYMLQNPSFYSPVTCLPPTSLSGLVFGWEHHGNLQLHLAGPSHVVGLGSCLCLFDVWSMHRLLCTWEAFMQTKEWPVSWCNAALRHPVLMRGSEANHLPLIHLPFNYNYHLLPCLPPGSKWRPAQLPHRKCHIQADQTSQALARIFHR